MEFKRVYGPPGSGKTTWLADQARIAAEKFGDDKVVISSFTRAAAVEIGSRNTGVLKSNCGTLHALCYRAYGNPELAEAHVKEWNDVCGPSQQLETRNDDDPYGNGHNSGDDVFRLYQLLRNKRTPSNAWPRDVAAFASSWTEWKRTNGFQDFTDLIEFGLAELSSAPGLPKALFVDEAQDLNPLQLALVEQWSKNTEWTIMVGDPDQSIYSFAGSDPYAFVNAPADQKFHPASLRRSWRLPRAIHAWSLDWIRQIRERDEIVFEPRDADGEVVQLGSHIDWREPDTLIRLIKQYTEQGKKVGVLGTCGYMLDPLKKELRMEGVPFHNPWRITRGDWNPLSKVADRVGVFLRPCREVWAGQADCWTGPMLNRWADGVGASGVFKHGAKVKIKALKDVARPLYTELLELFEVGVMEEIMARCERSAAAACEWLMDHAINDQMRQRLSYPIRCIEKSGPRALFDEPRIVIGTGHSVKGADKLDVVVLLPDLSGEADKQWRTSGHLRDSITRLIYVMATRARETLLLAHSSGDLAVWN